MTQRQQLITPALLGKRMLLGAGIAFILILVFLLPIRDPKPEWGRLWMMRPLIIVPLAGAAGGAFYYFMEYLSYMGGWRKVLATVVSLLVYIIGLWLGTVLGLAGTLWH